MSEKFRKVVNAPHRAVKKLKENIKATKPEKTAGKIARGAGVATTGFVQAMLWFIEHFTLDNFITRAGERGFAKIKVGKDKNGNDKKFQKFIKENPNFTAIVSWWMMLAAVTGVGAGIKNKDKIRNWLENPFEKIDNPFGDVTEEKYEPGTYGAYFDRMKTITPFLIADLIAKEGVHMKYGLHVPYLDSTGHWTIGFGSTMLKDGTHVTANTPPITTEEAYELARWHLEEGETYFGMYCYDVAFDKVDIDDVAEAFAMGSIMYNSFANLIEEPSDTNCKERFTNLRKLYKEYGRALTDEQVLEVFGKYPVVNMRKFGKAWLTGKKPQVVADQLGYFLKGGRGLIWRRWLEAGLLTGDITPQMLLDCPMGGLYDFFERKGGDREAFFSQDINGNRQVKRETYTEFKEWLKAPVDKGGYSLVSKEKVRDYMPLFALEACDGKECKLGDKASKKQQIKQKKVERDTYALDYDRQYELIMREYYAGNYKGAATMLEELLMAYPDNALLHNDLAVVYNHLGRYEDAIAHTREVVKRIGDKSQYAAAQYNAGFAYEQLGQLEKALANYKLSVANGNKKVQSDVTRVKNKMNKRTMSKSKKVAFNTATGRVKTNSVRTGDLRNIKKGVSRA